MTSPAEPELLNNPQLRNLLRMCKLDRTFVRGEGAWLTDTAGRRYLDAYAQYGAVVLGHNAPEVAAAARAALDAWVPAMVQPYPASQAEALGAALAAVAPGHPRRAVFTTSGAETVEAAIKLVRSRSGREVCLAASGSYHGKTLGALSLTGRAHHAEGFGPLAPGFDHVPFGDSAALEERLDRDRGRIAAVFLEPIQGEGGVILPPPDYLKQARALTARHGVALVVDEIQTGLGRTGRLFACEDDGVAPDVLLLAKGLGGGLFPLGACLVSDDWWDERFALGHSSTFANNNVACAVGLAVLQALDRHRLARVMACGMRLGAGLGRLRARYPRVVADVRGRGLMWALELAPLDDRRSLLLGYLQHHGLSAYAAAGVLAENSAVLVLPTLGTSNVLRIAPPLVVTEEQIDLVLDGLESLCAQLARNPAETMVRALGWDRPAPAVTAPVPPPPPQPSTTGRRRWAFLIHYTRPEDVRLTEPGLARLTDDELRAFCGRVSHLPAGLCLRAPVIRSATGAEAEGFILALPLLPEEMLRRGRRRMVAAIRRGVDLAAHLGADVVGLGGFTTPLSGRGTAVLGRGPLVSTGNALTAAAAFQAAALELRGRRWSDLRVAVLGARGSVGALLARLVAREQPRQLLLYGNPKSDPAPLHALCADLGRACAATAVSSDPAALGTCEVVLSATGAARPVLDALPLAKGALVCDVARPADAGPVTRGRADLTVIEGGLVGLPDPTLTFGPGNLQGLPPGIALACLSETILHALEGTRTNFGVGDDIPVSEADWALALCQRHGFRVAPLHGGDDRARAVGGGR